MVSMGKVAFSEAIGTPEFASRLQMFFQKLVPVQWNLGIRDTQGTVKNFLNSEVVLLLRSISMY